jgi:hypothetical protein
VELSPGTLIADRYRVLDPLGQGGAGWVYRARDTRMDVDVALKSAPPLGPSGHEAFKARVKREAKIGFMLGKVPGIVRCLDWGTLPDGKSLFMVLELVEGARPLDVDTGPLDVRLRRLLTAASRVAVCHQKSVVHRDVKPQNFLMSHDGIVFLTDFGSAKVITREAKPGDSDFGQTMGVRPTNEDGAPIDVSTQVGTLLGTPLYMAPEQFRDPGGVDTRSDVYSLGVMLYHVLTGRYPFIGTNALEIMSNQVLVESGISPPPPAPRALDGSIPEALDALCRQTTALKRDQRPADADAFCEALAGAADLRPTGQHAKPKPKAVGTGRTGRLTREEVLGALGIEKGGFTAPDRLRAAALKLGPQRARALLEPALAIIVTHERPVDGVARYQGKVGLAIPKGGAGDRSILGRAEADLTLELVTVSKAHLSFEREGGRWVAIEAGSRNGTRFNGGALHPGQRQPLADGDELAISDHVTLTVAGWKRLAAHLGLPER